MKRQTVLLVSGWVIVMVTFLAGSVWPSVRTEVWLVGLAVALGVLLLALARIHHSVGQLKARQLQVLRETRHHDSTRQLVTMIREDIGSLRDELTVALQSREMLVTSAQPETTPRVLLVSSNGAGLGHLVRLLAVQRALDAESHVYTLSTAHDRLGLARGRVTYYPSSGTLGLHPSEWHGPFLRHFSSVLRRYDPDLVLFDGPVVFRAITSACRSSGVRLVWMRRGTWKLEVAESSAQLRRPERYCDAVIVPGDYGGEDPPAVGGDHLARLISPITLLTQKELLPREEALAELGLDPEGYYALVQLGAGRINQIDDLRRFVIQAVNSLGPKWRAVVSVNPLQNAQQPSTDALAVTAFPVARYFHAFEFGVFAGGYNSVQESIAFNLPSVMVPNAATLTDDQVRRVRRVAKAGLALAAEDHESLGRAIARLADPKAREDIRERLRETAPATGAQEAATLLRRELDLARLLRGT